MKKLFQKIKALFIRIKPQFQNTIETAVMITEKVKEIINSPAIDVLTQMTAFEQDEKILAALRNALGYVSDVLGIAKKHETPSKQLQEIAKVMRKRSPQFQKLFYRELSSALAHALSDGKLTAWELFTLTQTAYRALKDGELDTSNIKNESLEDENPEILVDAVFNTSVEELMEQAGKTMETSKDTSNE
jgi:hypothetical protein